MRKVAFIVILILVVFSNCSKYPSVKIGNQEWMTENLNVDHFRNGDSIQYVTTSAEWEEAGYREKPAWSYYDNNPNNGKIYGKLYNWYAVNDPRGLAPEGWHVPSEREWTILTEYLGGPEIKDRLEDGKTFWYTPIAGDKMKSIGTQYWFVLNEDATNSSGFSGFPGGIRIHNCGILNDCFRHIGEYGYWWSSSAGGTHEAWSRILGSINGNVNRYNLFKYYGLSVRCLKD